MTDPRDDGFVGRWSRRKRAARAGEPASAEAAPPEAAGPPGSAATETEGDPEVIARLPDLERADDNTDFTVFLQQGVPEALRRQALRKLWRVNPVLANLDGLNDYDEDYTQLAAWGRGMKTLYKIGEGFAAGDDSAAEPTPAASEPEPGPVAPPPANADASAPPGARSADASAPATAAAPAADTAVAQPKGAARLRRWGRHSDHS